ncbi:MAG: hypothetical protein ACK50E_01940 [Bacteroidota bacterium]
MKRVFYSSIALILIFLMPSCRSNYPLTSINYLSGTEQTVSVRVVGVGATQESAIINAEHKVFDVLFFRGLPESNQKTAMVGTDETAEKMKNKKYFDNFYDGNRHRSFILSSTPVSGLIKVKGGNSITVDVKINLSALRNDLEAFGVIRKFGF